ncbi:class I SAM-dependent methyltransferase [Asanoa iriomotensis]|uniref:class I SAM-dependent methyltransferase n=1 Tax=Asanoa iriomotensis TaxID=234613 RepID=UPI001941BD39|nr:class I SAM-dependent methyltransferase [Asanoa iriomotensis]
MDENSRSVVDFYTNTYQEDGRLTNRPQARLEWTRTMELLRSLLPDAPARVLDVGGGTGVYARALTASGYQVRLVDLTPAHVALAAGGEPPIDAVVGDARALPEAADAYEATLLLGPLYHLLRAEDRVAALCEAVRVTRPGGRVVAAAISRFAGPIDFAATGRLTEAALAEARTLLDRGANGPGSALPFIPAYFHRVEELVAEFHAAGLTEVEVHGVEGPAWPAADAAVDGPLAEAVFAGALDIARVYSTEPALLAASAHLLAVARA